MSFFGAVKKKAKLALRGSWGGAAGACALTAGLLAALGTLELALLCSTAEEPSADLVAFLWKAFSSDSYIGILISAGFTLLSLLLFSPLSLGAQRYCFLASHQEAPRFRDLFFFFTGLRSYCKAVWFTVQVNLRCLLWGILFFALPSGLMAISTRFLSVASLSRESRAAASIGVVLACGLFLLAGVLFGIFVQKYALGVYLLCRDDSGSVHAILRESIRCSKGYRGMLLLFSLSYAGWFLLTPFTFFLLLILYVLPYRATGGMVMARYLCERHRLEREEASSAAAES